MSTLTNYLVTDHLCQKSEKFSNSNIDFRYGGSLPNVNQMASAAAAAASAGSPDMQNTLQGEH